MRYALIGAAGFVCAGQANAADHIDAPNSTADPAADVSDFYAWFTDDGDHFVTIVDFAGLGAAGDPAMYDPDVVYVIHLDRDDDEVSDVDIAVRFGQDSLGSWGVQVSGLPGAGAPQVGRVETVFQVPGGRVFAGLRDDPFNFDFTGFTTTNTNCARPTPAQPRADFAIDGTHDDFAGTNVTAIVIEMDTNAVLGEDPDNHTVAAWVTTGRI